MNQGSWNSNQVLFFSLSHRIVINGWKPFHSFRESWPELNKELSNQAVEVTIYISFPCLRFCLLFVYEFKPRREMRVYVLNVMLQWVQCCAIFSRAGFSYALSWLLGFVLFFSSSAPTLEPCLTLSHFRFSRVLQLMIHVPETRSYMIFTQGKNCGALETAVTR